MLVIRPIRMSDLDALLVLVGQALSGLTTLPPDADVLARRIKKSEYSFGKDIERPGDEGYLFVLEDTEHKQIVGICGIEAKTGGYLPFYAYQMQHEKHQCEQLQIQKNIPVLSVYSEHDGPSEVCSLFLSPQFRQKGSGRLLSLSRFLFMADQQQRFEKQVIAELRGTVDADGHSPFWEAIAKHFIDMPFEQADYLSIRDKRFIGDLMPRHPIYVPLLPEAAQKVIGQVHRNTRPALALLQSQGFHVTELIDIFEAGPIVRCNVADIYAVAQSAVMPFTIDEQALDADLCLISNATLDYRCVLAPLRENDGVAHITAETAQALQLLDSTQLRWVSAYPQSQASAT